MERTYEVLSKRWDSSHVFCCSPKDGHVLHFSQFPFAEDEQPNWSYVDLTEYTNAPSAITTEKVTRILLSTNALSIFVNFCFIFWFALKDFLC